MKIDMNKDFEKEFQYTLWKGLGGREVLSAVIAFLVSGAMVVALWHFTGLPINVCVYFGIPVMVPIAAVGIVRYQGATLWEMVKELNYLKKTRELPYEAMENTGGGRSFTMGSPVGKEKR